MNRLMTAAALGALLATAGCAGQSQMRNAPAATADLQAPAADAPAIATTAPDDAADTLPAAPAEAATAPDATAADAVADANASAPTTADTVATPAGDDDFAAIYGADPRKYQIVTKRFVGDKDGNVKELHTVQIEWVKGEGGRMQMKEVPGTEKVWPADLVLLAMGFLGPEKEGLLSDLGVKLDERTNVAVDANKMTSVPGIFAAGDMARGQSLIVWAIKEGREAARGVDKFLMGETQLP